MKATSLMFVSKVRNRFVPRLRRGSIEQAESFETATCPFPTSLKKKRTQWALTREEMKDCVWLESHLVAQVEFTDCAPDGHLRYSKFCSMREAHRLVRE
jgi:hypothetical protein